MAKYTSRENGFEINVINNEVVLVKDEQTGDTTSTQMPDPATYKGVFARQIQRMERIIARYKALDVVLTRYFESKK